jgi:NAD(P)-dependent dehydrogenase (short-subunit alcohol dehydrogenase family)|tara:strand:- start:119 stop:1111 length:993 start_codon:yes stop_codon:yes gene_type:complete
MDSFEGKIAVVTGGGTGMGRELCLQLVKEGCNVATCDVLMENLEETKTLCQKVNPDILVTLHQCDVSSEEAMNHFRDEVIAAHGDKINLLFNNAGIGGGGSFMNPEDRADWERTFNVCWYGVYYGCRAFIESLVNADESHIVNTSSINGFWASLGPNTPHTAYCSAKFAVKGFSEALVTDLRLNAPHVGVSVVMPGHIGTSIAINSGKVLGRPAALDMSEEDIKDIRERMMNSGGEMSEVVMNLSDDQIREFMHQRGIAFRDNAPTSAGEAATIILDGVKAGKWRILVGEDAHRLDERVRTNPESAYEASFIEATRDGGDLVELIGTTEQ